MASLRDKSFRQEMFATDGFNTVRTEPTENKFVGFIRNPITFEKKVSYSNTILNNVLQSGDEITREKYNTHVLPTSDLK